MSAVTSSANDLLTTGEVARLLDRSPDLVRWLERRGELHARRTVGANGFRLFARADVEELIKKRSRQR